MGMGQQDVCGEDARLLHQLMAERPQSTAGIEDYQTLSTSCDADAGGVAAVTRCFRTGSWDGPSSAPECHGVCHDGRLEVLVAMAQPLATHKAPAAATVTEVM
jgi:hypothetical protein